MSAKAKKSYLDICRRCVEKAVGLGAEWCDVSAGAARDISVTIEKTGIKTADAGQGEDLAIRVFVRGGMGYASVSGSDRRDINEAVERAVALAKEATPDPDFRALPPAQPAPEVEGLFDSQIAGMSVGDVVRVAVANIQAAKALEPDVNLTGHVGLAVGEGALASSTGVALQSRATEIGADIDALLARGGDKGFFSDFDCGRLLADTQLEKVSESAVLGARRFLGARRIHSGRMTLVLGPLAASGFLGSLVAAANAESIQRGRSFLCGKLGAAIASEHLSIVDNGLIPRGLHSGAHDGEGTRRRPLTVIDRGRLVSLLHNSYTAGKAGGRSNGHSSGAGCAPTNLRPRPGEMPAEEIIRGVKRGLYVNSASLMPNPSSGDISALVEFGMAIENGKLAAPVANVTVVGHILKVLSDIDAISSDYRSEPGNVLPTIRIRGMDISGAG